MICLSARGLRQTSIVNDENKFTFVVGKDKTEYHCSKFQACFISKKVSDALSSDPTLEKLLVLPDQPCSYFNLIERLWNGDEISIESANLKELVMLSRELGNDELNRVLHSHLLDKDISIDNCIARLHLKQSIGLDGCEEIRFIASRFSAFDVKLLSVSEFEQVLTSDSLKLENENSLLDAILGVSACDPEYATLLKYVRFEFLDLEHFTAFMNEIYPHQVDFQIWESMTRLLSGSLKNTFVNKRYTGKEHWFKYDLESPTTGIFSYLRNECGGNPHLKRLIEVTASTTQRNQCYRVLDYGWNDDWHTGDVPNSWIKFDFIDKKVCLTSYTIKTYTRGSCHLKEWKIEASNNGTEWVLIDERKTDKLNGYAMMDNFSCSHSTNDFFRYIRLTSTGPNWHNYNHLIISEIEFFGGLLITM